MRRFAGPAAVDAMLFEWKLANRALRVWGGNVCRFVWIAQLRCALELVEEASPCCPEPGLAVPRSFMPESSFSFAHK